MLITNLSVVSNIQSFYYESWGILEGKYKPQSEFCNEGFFVTPDGIEFPASLKGGSQGKLKEALDFYHPLTPGQLLENPSWWLVFPKAQENGQLWLTLAKYFRKAPPKKNQVFKAVGLLQQQIENTITLKVSRNRPHPQHPDQTPNIDIVLFKGETLGIENGQPVQVIGHRDGDKLIADDVQIVTPELLAQKQQEQQQAAIAKQKNCDRQRSQASQQPNPQPPETELFQAIATLEARYIPQQDNPTRGILVTADGCEFKSFLGRSSLTKALIRKHGPITPGEPFPNEPIDWVVYPKLGNGELNLTIVNVKTEHHKLQAEQLKAQGILLSRSSNCFCLRVYRNIKRGNRQQLTDYSDIELHGIIPDNALLGSAFRVLAHRTGQHWNVDELESITIHLSWQVKNAIKTIGLSKFPPAPPPTKRAQIDTTAATSEAIATPPPNTPQTLPIDQTPSQTTPLSDIPAIADTLHPVEPPLPEPDISQKPEKSEQPGKTAIPTATPTEQSEPNTTTPTHSFVVYANGRQFFGSNSVALKAGMLLIDGFTITPTKLAIVVGDAAQVNADGKIQKKGNRTTLSSR